MSSAYNTSVHNFATHMCHLPYNCHLHSQWARLRHTKVACHIYVSFAPALTETRRFGIVVFILFYRNTSVKLFPRVSTKHLAQPGPSPCTILCSVFTLDHFGSSSSVCCKYCVQSPTKFEKEELTLRPQQGKEADSLVHDHARWLPETSVSAFS